MIINVSDAERAVLDYLVAKCEGIINSHGRVLSLSRWCPSADWAQGGPIMECERIIPGPDAGVHFVAHQGGMHLGYGPSYLIAAMRCYVISKLGNKVEVPDGLN